MVSNTHCVRFPLSKWKVNLKFVYIYFPLLDVTTHSFSNASFFSFLCHRYTFLITFPLSPLIPLTKILLLCLLSSCLYRDTLFFFSRLPHLTPPILPPAGCKMDSPQSESSEEEQKAEEKGAQGELQRGRRRSPTMHLASALILSWRRPFPFGDWSVFVCLTTKWFSVFYVLYIYIYMCEDTQYCSWSRLCLSCVLLPRV